MWFYCRGLGCNFVVKSGDVLRKHHAECLFFERGKRGTSCLYRKCDYTGRSQIETSLKVRNAVMGSSTFDELIEEFRLVHRDLEWSDVNFEGPGFLDKTMYFSWGEGRFTYSASDIIIATFDDPRPMLAKYNPYDTFEDKKRTDHQSFKSYLYAFYIIRRPKGVTKFALSAEHYQRHPSNKLLAGKFLRGGFKLVQPPLSCEEANWPQQEIISGTVRQIFAGYIFPRNPTRLWRSYREKKKKIKHLERLSIPLRQILSDILTPYFFRACHQLIVDYFLGA
ncbi:MAG: hypothetical protein Hyperionvirus6_101 [Hyperionvirus sp.]|uniref:Uncharacterized protein n=1 Tax=Hyperionvirus sp. TaxID=2487770 RepID=A0A3G5A804_9VIRU|nr:MAG: hypothetical protein Hyperionvirus6_101 [Hyperionvirus sp.]